MHYIMPLSSRDLIPSNTFFNLVHIAAIAPVLAWIGLQRGENVPVWVWNAMVGVALFVVIFHAWRYMDKTRGLA